MIKKSVGVILQSELLFESTPGHLALKWSELAFVVREQVTSRVTYCGLCVWWCVVCSHITKKQCSVQDQTGVRMSRFCSLSLLLPLDATKWVQHAMPVLLYFFSGLTNRMTVLS